MIWRAQLSTILYPAHKNQTEIVKLEKKEKRMREQQKRGKNLHKGRRASRKQR
jgi:hypothetical protein